LGYVLAYLFFSCFPPLPGGGAARKPEREKGREGGRIAPVAYIQALSGPLEVRMPSGEYEEWHHSDRIALSKAFLLINGQGQNKAVLVGSTINPMHLLISLR
jgi:hypothetical protein